MSLKLLFFVIKTIQITLILMSTTLRAADLSIYIIRRSRYHRTSEADNVIANIIKSQYPSF